MKNTRDVLRHAELLDCPHVDDRVRLLALRDVARANRYFGGIRVLRRELSQVLRSGPGAAVTALDVGAASGDLGYWIQREARRRAVAVKLYGIDLHPALARAARDSGTAAVCGDAMTLPFRTRSVDIVICSQLLHHFTDSGAIQLLREVDRVARHRVIVCDLRRSLVAAGGFWLAAHLLRFHPVTRHDGVASVRRGFTGPELTRLVHAAVGLLPLARPGLGFRLAVSWTPTTEARQ